jgi:hypothetical protein
LSCHAPVECPPAGSSDPRTSILSGVSLITKTKYVFNPELREMRNQTKLFVFGL